MDEEKHESQLEWLHAGDLVHKHAADQHVIEHCMFDCGETADVAWQIAYEVPGASDDVSRWLYICELCDGESRKLAPYWWNKALRGEALDDEEE
jgi:hypothetical protein